MISSPFLPARKSAFFEATVVKLTTGHSITIYDIVMDYCTSAHVDLSKDVQPHLCRFAAQRQSPVQKQFSTHHVQRRMLKPGCQIVGSVTSDKVTTVADSQECRAFSVAGPMAWNSLPNFFQDPTSSAD